MTRLTFPVLLALACAQTTRAEDWPTFGRDRTHNAVSPEKNAPTDWQVDVRDKDGKGPQTARNIAWSATLGISSIGGPVVADGLVWVSTNNENPRDPQFTDPKRINPITKKPLPIDMAVLMCFRAADGKFLWQYTSPRLKTGMPNDCPHGSLGTAPLVEGDRIYFQTNRAEVVCYDIGPLKRGDGRPKELWKHDMLKLGVFPNSPIMAAGFNASVAADAERLFVVTGNGVDQNHENVPAPEAPSLICLDKKTGQLLWKDASPGKNIMHAQRSSPLVVEVQGKTQVIVGQGDGWLRSFEATSGKLIWKCDLNPKSGVYRLGSESTANYVMATPVFHDGRVYIATGQDPERAIGAGYLSCIDPTKQGDISLELSAGPGKGKPNPDSAVVWRFGGPDKDPNAKRDYLFGRTICDCIAHDGLLYVCDLEGFVFCFDAKTGHLHWQHDTRSEVWGTPLWADGKVYVPTTDGDLFIFAHGKAKKLIATIDMNEPLRSTPVFANGTLYLMGSKLYAIRQTK